MSTRLAVVVPAANEQDTIGACLEAVLTAAAATGGRVEIVVVLDACTDATADIVASFPVTAVPCGHGNVGAARRLGARHALPALGADGVLASTDADSLVPADWLVELAAMTRTADLVLGTVVPGAGLPADVERDWYRRHELRDGHPHVHGANLAIRAGAYRRLGGWRPLASGEDTDLAARAAAAGLRIHRTGRVPVRTSPRLHGRTPHGFSSYLRGLGEPV